MSSLGKGIPLCAGPAANRRRAERDLADTTGARRGTQSPKMATAIEAAAHEVAEEMAGPAQARQQGVEATSVAAQ